MATIRKIDSKITCEEEDLIEELTAIGIAAITAANKNKQGGITGFQASAIMWEFINRWKYSHNKCGLRLIAYDNYLYPQYYTESYNLPKTIPLNIMKRLQSTAKVFMADRVKKKSSSRDVWEHWEKLSSGVLPNGYSIRIDTF